MNGCYLKYRTLPVEENLILYESYRGAGMVCNPYAVFKAFLAHEDFNKYKHVWSIDDEEELKRLKEEYREHTAVDFVLRTENDGEAYARCMATAEYVVHNNSLPYCFAKRPCQTVIIIWHSVTVKALGFDSANRGLDPGTSNSLRCFLQSDYIASANEFMTQTLVNSYKLPGLYSGVFIQEGQPRVDLTLKTPRDYILRKLRERGISVVSDKKIILYAPTWREKDLDTKTKNAENYLEIYSAISSNIDAGKYQVLIKPHSQVYMKLSEADKHNSVFVPQSVDANELLSVSDILITDYSSIYFDFLQTSRPILFYIPDLAQYKADRGLYFTTEQLPGPRTSDLNELAEYIRDIDIISAKYDKAIAQTRAWACKYDDGDVSRRIVDIVFKGQKDYNIIGDFYTDKMRLLIYIGEIKPGKDAENVLERINGIDCEKFDVTVYCLLGSDNGILSRLPICVRILRQVGECVSTDLDAECRRCFGDVRFDYAVDLSREGTPFSNVLPYAAKSVLSLEELNPITPVTFR